MKLQRVWLIVGLIVILSLVLAACGGGGTTETPAATEAPAEEVAPTEKVMPRNLLRPKRSWQPKPTDEAAAPTEEAAATEAPAEEAAATEAPAEGEGVTLRWRTRPDNQAEIDVYQQVNDSIDIPGVTLVYEPGGSESSSYQDVLKTELAAGTAPDVFWIPGHRYRRLRAARVTA